ncbi:HlyD family type I secretion periplasmic adaptor subunit [Ramlibacter alkalitolerans]|uniref:Membrane fusion protein (MFP) family protein n=1 Tax=Ramlibacter alkalitolerans TaxID=2039631 RepID=A0ABS1JR88_9BURK|nr:HlyD family type I secretion periplasmic adaptor subunit [Ramlibacter alkalitolerans]MBL0426785.1 HlyD family type I secretion periplasmic adaptor subunit [Ramlibacter alkalitolerans]
MNTATLSPAAAGPSTSEKYARRLVRAGTWIVFGGLLPIGLWMGLAPLSMAVVAPAVVKVDLNRRQVQHLEGGVVAELLVRDGQHVNAGDPVLVLGDVRVDAERNRLDYRVLVERAALARLEAEHAVAPTLTFPKELLQEARQDARIEQALQKESGLFRAQRHALTSGTTLLRAQRERVEQEMVAIRAQIAQGQKSLELQRSDLESNRRLIGEGFISASRIAQLEAVVIDYGAKLEERRSELARADQRLADLDMRIESLRNEYVKSASDQLKQTTQRLSEVEQELRKSEDAAKRQVVVAPVSGEIIDLKVASPGAVVRAGDPIADIVPSDTQLMVEARVRPEDIANVHQGQQARLKFTALRYRNATMVEGKVAYVSADRLTDRQTGEPYYTASIVADSQSLASLGDFKLQAGMSAEVYIQGTQQTTLQYIAEPVMTTLRRSARQL